MDANVAFAEALAMKANHSGGSIFLDPEEELACRGVFIQDHPELANCSFYEFSKAGAGICYNETVDDINKKLGKDLNNLQTICDGTLKDMDSMSNSQACRDCHGKFNNETGVLNKELSGRTDVPGNVQDCGLALFIVMGASRIYDNEWIQSLNSCLVYEQLDNEVVAATVGAVAILLALMVLVKKIKEKKKGVGKTKALGADGSPVVRFSTEEILEAINNTAPWAFLGEGSTGKVYKGRLPSGQFVAIKHISKDVVQADAFETKIKTILKIRHKNLVSLLGYCDEDGEKYFVYEYCANGNLSQMLLGLEDKVLTWEQRLKIAYGCVIGLRFLHLYPDGCIVHRDIKPNNILLTESMEAKLADFGLIRIFKIQETKVFTTVKGTRGYLDPEYVSQGRLTCSSDIYSFGVVLLQLLSGKGAIDLDQSYPDFLVKAHEVVHTNPIDPSKYADPRLNGEYSREAFIVLLKLAVICTASSYQGRPSVLEVYGDIQNALTLSSSLSL
ncbi:probable serine/threonine-protein kinase PBL28 [Cryptomeria japonica]|uniref:probable serine/threonine-protein kinase PBL28 n=1 Tax=Cryptomeria japonica TaxID=3369 RepID=UPI0027D9F434|nr:probable serine/threonine-protein kinase PBL28 [Cryptomeria japonica]